MSCARRVFLAVFTTAALYLCLRCEPSVALTLDAAALAAALESAPLVVDVRIEHVEDATDRPTAHLRAEATVERVWRDHEGPPDRITIVVPGGNRDSTGVAYSGFPWPEAGHRYRATLTPSSSARPDEYEVVGFRWGFQPLDAVPGATRAFSRNRTDGTDGVGSGPFLRWNDNAFPVPFAMRYEDFFGRKDMALAIERAFLNWRDVVGVRWDVMPMGCVRGIKDGNDGINTVLFVSKDWPFGATAIAVTRNHYFADGPRAGQILDTDILLNAVNYQFSADAEPGKQDVENVITHEVGHFVGLGHETAVAPVDVNSTMYAFAVAGETLKRTLADNDIAGIQAAYPGQGFRPPWTSLSQLCELELGPSCGAVPYPLQGPSPLRALLLFVTWLVLLLGAGRAFFRARR